MEVNCVPNQKVSLIFWEVKTLFFTPLKKKNPVVYSILKSQQTFAQDLAETHTKKKETFLADFLMLE